MFRGVLADGWGCPLHLWILVLLRLDYGRLNGAWPIRPPVRDSLLPTVADASDRVREEHHDPASRRQPCKSECRSALPTAGTH